MRIAVFTPYLPYPPDTGGKIRSYHLLRALATRFEVDLYTVYHGKGPSDAAVREIEKDCRRVVLFHLKQRWRTRDRIRRALFTPLPRVIYHFHTPASLEEARRCLDDSEYDLVITDEICMTPYAELAPNLPRIVTRQKVDRVHHKEVAMARPWGLEKVWDLIEVVKWRRYEQAKMPLYHAYLACSEQDVMLISKDAPDMPALVIPNGADLDQFVPSGLLRTENPTLLYVGSMNYYPNVDAVQFFFEAMYEEVRREAPEAWVQIVGHAPPPEIQQKSGLPGVEVTGTVPDVRPYYERATVFIVPLRLGGGTRLKIIEAMAMGLPVVSTTVGAEGLEICPGESILIADDPSSFVESVRRLLSDPHLHARIAQGGRALARRYDWKELTKPYADLVEKVAKQWKQKN
jgi:polysaccharide biosynthesis protein PslH